MIILGAIVSLLGIFAITATDRNVVASSKLIRTNTTNYTANWPNDSTINVNSTRKISDLVAVDCLGLGSAVAETLEWWFSTQESHTNAQDVKFFFSSRKHPSRLHLTTGEQFGLEWTDFNVERRTVFIVHGFLSNGSQSWVKRMEEAFLLWGDVNLIVVDWSARGNSFNYIKAVVNTRIVGKEIARLLHHIVNATIASSASYEPKWGPLHLVGHSLGAHICGFAAGEFKKRQNKWNVSRISGLDPANRCFRNVTAAERLDSADAAFVDVIHTNGLWDKLFAFGSPQSIGHVDFYPNGGRTQPACSLERGIFPEFITGSKATLQEGICSHGYSYIYFTESLISSVTKNCTFWAHRWDRSYRRALQLFNETCNSNNCTEMGIEAENHPNRGTFFVVTSPTFPHCATNDRSKDKVLEQMKNDYANEILD